MHPYTNQNHTYTNLMSHTLTKDALKLTIVIRTLNLASYINTISIILTLHPVDSSHHSVQCTAHTNQSGEPMTRGRHATRTL